MKLLSTALALLPTLWLCTCAESSRGTSRCRTDLTYVTNQFTQGENALTHASEYRANVVLGSDDYFVNAIIDTASANLVIATNSYDSGVDSVLGKKPFVVDNGHEKVPGINAKDSVDIGCIENLSSRFALTAKESQADNYLGLAYSDTVRHPHEQQVPSFFSQLVKDGDLKDEFSLALCGARADSWLLLGGIDQKMDSLLGNFIPITEKTAYVVPALSLRRADTKQMFGEFPAYDPDTKMGVRTIIDSATSFLLLPSDMAEKIAQEVESQADAFGILKQFPSGFFRTERSSSTKLVRFNNLAQIRQFPWFEINFVGYDGKTKALELSPLHYLKEIDPNDPLIRVFAVRETSGDVVLGQPFLENHYTYFDRKNGRIGFADIDIACGQR